MKHPTLNLPDSASRKHAVSRLCLDCAAPILYPSKRRRCQDCQHKRERAAQQRTRDANRQRAKQDTCPDCGTTFQRDHPKQNRCRPCAAEYRRTRFLKIRHCEACQAVLPKGQQWKRCAPCRERADAEARRARLRRHKDATKRKQLSLLFLRPCKQCGKAINGKGKKAWLCEGCAKARANERLRKDRAAKRQTWSGHREELHLFGMPRKEARAELIKRDGLDCYLCGEPILSSEDSEIDHVIPLSKGGRRNIGNCRLTHRECNQAKSSHVPGNPKYPARFLQTHCTDPRSRGAFAGGAWAARFPPVAAIPAQSRKAL